jgi:hypothetical protein
METKPQFEPPPTLSMAHHLADWPEALPTNIDRAVNRQPVQIDNLIRFSDVAS